MKRPALFYQVEPSFDEEQRLRVEIVWDDNRNQFRLDIKKGSRPRKRQWFDDNSNLKAILEYAEPLQLPACINGPSALDGKIFRLTIGHLPSVTFSWWMEILKDWTSLRPIIDRIDKLVEQEMV